MPLPARNGVWIRFSMSGPAEPLARFYGPLKPRADQVTTSGADRLYREVLLSASWG
jgi:hypothetical protein